jgi:hypothetical protein
MFRASSALRFERIGSPAVVRRTAVLVALPLVLAGCGGGGSTGANSARSQFIARADGICRSAQQKAKPLMGADKTVGLKNVDAVMALLNKAANELAAVKPPANLRAGYQRFLALAKKEVAVLAKFSRYLHEHNLADLRSIAGQLSSPAINDQARQLGLTVCAEELA